MKSLWIVFSGTDEVPVATKLISNKTDLYLLKLNNDEWVEEFEVKEKEDDREICRPSNK
jgi:hypothetical protein